MACMSICVHGHIKPILGSFLSPSGKALTLVALGVELVKARQGLVPLATLPRGVLTAD